MNNTRGDDLWIHEHSGVLMRVQLGEDLGPISERDQNPEELVRLKAERLQEAMDRAALRFADSTRPPSKPFPDHLLMPRQLPSIGSPSPYSESLRRKRTRGSS
jgi:hypothetical protein